VTLLSPPYALGAAGQVLSGKNLRLVNGASFRQGASGVLGISGCLHGPANTMGELTLPSNTQLTVQAFRAVIQSSQDATAGQYLAVNDAAVTLAVPAQNASQWRRALVVVRVDDSQVAGVASSATTDRAVLEIVSGNLAASSGAAALPATPNNALLLGELLIPPTGQTVTLTPYNPRTGTRGGILPVLNDGSTVAGHSGASGTYLGEYRDHPTLGLQRWDGATWQTIGLGGDVAYTTWAPSSPTTQGGSGGCGYMIRNKVCFVNIDVSYSGSFGGAFMVTAAPLPLPARTGSGVTWATGNYANNTNNPAAMLYLNSAGLLYTAVAGSNGVPVLGLTGSFSYPCV